MSKQKPVVFIHTNDKQMVGALVAKFSLEKTSANTDKFDVKIIRVENYPRLTTNHGKLYLREGKKVAWNNHDLQSFTPTRFLPPELMGYSGRAIVIDPDVFALKDIYSLLELDMEGKSIWCKQVIPKNGRQPYFATSVMLMDCSKLQHWKWSDSVEEMFTFKRDYRDWLSLYLEPEDSIGILEDRWNHFDKLNSETCLLHNTARITQPWKSGLPIDFTPKVQPKPLPLKWGLIPRAWVAQFKAFVQGRTYAPYGVYREHPDSKQVKLFFSLLKECIDDGIIGKDFLRSEIKRKHVRPDALGIIESL